MLKPTCVVLLGLFASARAAMEGFVAGGEYAKIANQAHSVFLDVLQHVSKEESWMCGSSILNQQLLLTAGHCCHGCSYASRIKIHVGSANRELGDIHDFHDFVIHENFDRQSLVNDICLVKVRTPLTLRSNAVTRVALNRYPPYGETATVAGWGVIDSTGRQSNYLKFVTQRVLKQSACSRIFTYLEEGTICAAAEHNEGYAALGDSGSALVVRGLIQIGLVSFKIPTKSKRIVIYTDVGYFYDWIKANAKELYCNY